MIIPPKGFLTVYTIRKEITRFRPDFYRELTAIRVKKAAGVYGENAVASRAVYGYTAPMRKRLMVFFIVTGFLVLFRTGGWTQEAPDGSLRITEDLDLRDYLPFAGKKVTALEEPASVTFQDNLPRLGGATAAVPLYTAFVQALYPPNDYRYGKVVNFAPTPQAYEALVDGRVDMIFCYAPSEEQKKLAAVRDLEYRMTPICKDAFVFFVNSQNPVENLTLRNIRDIYTGRVSNWKDAGGNDEPIIAYQRNSGSGSQTAFLGIMDGEDVMEPVSERIIMGMGDMIRTVADYRNNRGALGYSFRFFTGEMLRNNSIRLVAVDGIAPTAPNIRNGQYPFTETLYAITTGTENPSVQKLLKWIESAQGQRLIEKTGYIPMRDF
jgi:phosphate transport system substrate-binding protein